MKYCNSTSKTKRFKTREVLVGNVGVGGDNPIRIQSMTTSDTRDAKATADQIMKLADYGCEIARVTVQGKKEADACEEIKNILIQKNYTIPLVADIHFYPAAAMRAVDFVDKVRVNPGNFVDKRATFKTIEYDDATYRDEIKKIEDKFSPLVEKCIRLKRAIRIGTNHGSLSDRIMNRYGDTPFGMVESAIEFARVCRDLNYHDFMFSMKASNPLVMMQAYRLLNAEMIKLGWNYPLHLGVTEAGNKEDGRVKSAIGIGSLLLDGLGDTIRVSLTEDPWYEIDPCKRLVQFYESYLKDAHRLDFDEKARDVSEISKREVEIKEDAPLHRDGSVFVTINENDILKDTFYHDLGLEMQFSRPMLDQGSVDAIILKSKISNDEALSKLTHLKEAGVGILDMGDNKELATESLRGIRATSEKGSFVTIKAEDRETYPLILEKKPTCIILTAKYPRLHAAREFFEYLKENDLKIPIVLSFTFGSSYEDLVIESATEFGALLADSLGEGIHIEGDFPIENLKSLSFGILQGSRMRSSKTEYIACPSCGRTLFDLQEVTANIQEKTAHLPGVKIAVMGCIVNGPGEMADADFGYVGSKPGMIDLYVGKECVEKNIESDVACERLIELIKSHGRWVEPKKTAEEVVTV